MDAYIRAIEYYLPESVLTNYDMAAMFPEWPAEKIFAKVGVEVRHISAPNESASDMAVKAAEKLFAVNPSLTPESVDFVLFCTQSPDYPLPSTACIIQDRLGIPKSSGALDYDLGCSGWVYGLALAKGLIVSGCAENVLLLTGETYTKYLSPDDKGNRAIFSDGASAAMISRETGRARIGEFVFGTDGSHAGDLIYRELPTGGGGQFFMDGGNIFAFTLRAVPPMVSEVLAKNGIASGESCYYVMHQANKFMLEALRKKMGIPAEKFIMDMSRGNTVSSTIPIALKDAGIPEGASVVVAGFGVGLSWAGCVLRF